VLVLRDWLVELGMTRVGIESTGVYWKADGPRDFRTALLVAISCCVLPVQKLVVDLAWGLVSES
jgi:hypothetical protein